MIAGTREEVQNNDSLKSRSIGEISKIRQRLSRNGKLL